MYLDRVVFVLVGYFFFVFEIMYGCMYFDRMKFFWEVVFEFGELIEKVVFVVDCIWMGIGR